MFTYHAAHPNGERNTRRLFSDSGCLDELTLNCFVAPATTVSPDARIARHPMTSNERNNVTISSKLHNVRISQTFSFLSASVIWLALCLPLLAPMVNAAPLRFNTPTNLTQCIPVNLTWSGGNPPYSLDIVPTSLNGLPNSTALERFKPIDETWVTWIPDFVAGTTVNFYLIDNSMGPPAGGNQIIRQTQDSSCLKAASSSSLGALSTSTSTSDRDGVAATASVHRGSSSGSPAPSQSTGLGTGAIAAIGASIGAFAVSVIALVVWCIYRRRLRRRHTGFDIDKPLGSPSPSDTPTATVQERPFSALSSTVVEAIPSKLMACATPTESVIASGPSSPNSDRGVAFRPTPYLVQRDSNTSLSDLRKSKKSGHTRGTSSTNASTSDIRAGAMTPTQQSDAPEASVTGRTSRAVSPRFEVDSGVRLVVGPEYGGENGDGMSEGGATLPPPYSQF